MKRTSASMLVVALSALCAAAVACNLPAAAPPATPAPPAVPTATADAAPAEAASPTLTPTPLPTPTATPLPPPARLDALLADVSAERMLADVEALAAIPSRHANSPTIGDAVLLIEQSFRDTLPRLVVVRHTFPLSWDKQYSTQVNVIATLPGTDPSLPPVLLGAHYDSRAEDIHDAAARAPGANDNASGVAALIEAARVLGAADPLPADVIFAAFSAEEVGKLGSAAYVRDALAAGQTFRAVIALDTVGGVGGAETAGAVRAFSADPAGSPSRQLARHLDVLARASLPMLDVQVQDALDRPYRYSDHVPFSDAGFAAARLIEPVEDPGTNHSPADLPANLTPEILRQNAQLAVAAAAHLAAGPPPPDLTFVDGTLQWEAVPGAAAYVVAFRTEGEQAFGAVMQVSAGSTALPLDAADGEYAYASVAALSAQGWMGPFSAEIGVTPGE